MKTHSMEAQVRRAGIFVGGLGLALLMVGCAAGGSDVPDAANGSGGATSSGGAPASGGAVGSGGSVSSGGTKGSGGVTSSGGATGSGGATSSGGTTSSGGAPGSGGAVSSGGVMGGGGRNMGQSGGSNAMGGSSGSAGRSGGTAGAGGRGATATGGAGGDAGTGAKMSAGCGKAPATLKSATVNQATPTNSITVGGASRQFLVRWPTDYQNSKAYPLHIGLHGANGNISENGRDNFGLWSLSKNTVIFVTLAAVNGLWSATTDLAYADAVLKQVESELCIDTSKVVLEGFSQGGAMSWYITGSRPGVFRAVIGHSGGGVGGIPALSPVAYLGSLGTQEMPGNSQTTQTDQFAKAVRPAHLRAHPARMDGGDGDQLSGQIGSQGLRQLIRSGLGYPVS